MTATTNRFASTNPPSSACQPLIRALAIQIGAAKSRVRMSGTTATRMSSPIPSWPGLSESSTGHGHGNGAFQPPKNRVTVSAEMMNTLTYSAKKKKPKRMPEYSVANPATISESASVRSNGVRLASAVAAMKKISTRERLLEHVPVGEPARLVEHDLVEAHRPGQQDQADDRQRERDLVADDLRRRAEAAEQRVLVVARPAGHQQPDDRQPADGEEVQQPEVEVLAEQAGRERDDQQGHDARRGR